MLNEIVVMGRMVRDPELRRTGNGTAVASFTLACERDVASKDAEKKEVDFIDCVAWRGTGESAAKYFSKGRLAAVTGRLQFREWTDKEGKKRRNAEILVDHIYFCGDKKIPLRAALSLPRADLCRWMPLMKASRFKGGPPWK